MNKNVLIGIALAVVVVAIAAAALLMHKPPSGGATATAPSSGEKAYLYSVRLGGQVVQMSVVYIPLKDGAVYGELTPQGSEYYMFKDNGVINVLVQVNGIYRKYTYFSRPMEICVNSTATTTVAGEQLTVTDSKCRPSAAPLPTVKSFDELFMFSLDMQLVKLKLYRYIPWLPDPVWKKSGTAQTPFGEATVYTNTTEVPIMWGLNAVFNYEKQVLKDGSVYLFKFQLAYGTQVVATLTYTLQNITTVTPELRNAINELYKDVSAKPGGGLDILKVAQKIGMSYDGEWPAAIVFFDLQCPYCALLFKYNYTLFQGHKLVLVDLVVHPDALPAHERLRCLYQTSPDEVIPTLRVLYERFLAQDPNYTSVLPQSRCPFDASAGQQLATLLAGQDAGTPIVVVVYPNGTYTMVIGNHPAEIAKALKG
jgi:protein-disulfide isomerase